MQLLQQRVESLDQDARTPRQEVGSLTASSASLRREEVTASPELLRAAERLAQEIGFRLLSTELESDPDCSASTYYVLNVEAIGAPDELITRQLKWHEALDRVDQSYRGRVRICIFPVP